MSEQTPKKKIVIIGGGIAGMACAILLNRQGFEVVVCEREVSCPTRGNAFLMHAEGLAILKSLRKSGSQLPLPGQPIDTFSLKRQDNTEIKHLKMDLWQSIKRRDAVEYLYNSLPQSLVKSGRQFSHFIQQKDQVIAAVFENQEVEYGDLFIGADGARSMVRQALYGPTLFSPVEVREVVGTAFSPELVKNNSRTFRKFLSGKQGISFGFIPTSDEELVWFMQYDVRLYQPENEEGESLKKMCRTLLAGFPDVVDQILSNSDFSNAYLWHACDFDVLPSFHRSNVVLIGDAAHLALPFTSAGTTDALADAHILSKFLSQHADVETAFNAFYEERHEAIEEHLKLGRELKDNFLHVAEYELDDIQIPLIANQSTQRQPIKPAPKIHLQYFTDPVCSTCWTIQPQLRKLRMEYGDYLQINYCMGGLLPSWVNYDKGKIKNSQDAYEYWKSLANTYDMPVNPDVWKNDPLPSSYPPAIAFKAAQMQDIDKAVIYLRRLSELLFLKSINITDSSILLAEAFEAGLDVARFKRDLQGKAEISFEKDIELVRTLGITTLPTFIFSTGPDDSITLKGFQSYDVLEGTLKQLVPDLPKKVSTPSPESVFQKFKTLTTKEFAFLMDLELISALTQLQIMEMDGLVTQQAIYGSEQMWQWENQLSS
jgi:2-polyprenyl-6-methoxyphenol hydroxylase-like FAD-dependent oxidoreductase/predicted DsbA family dithiol-disulfide isomerase